MKQTKSVRSNRKKEVIAAFTPKPEAVRKTEPELPAPAKASAVISTPGTQKTASPNKAVIIEAKIDVGFGNTLFIRGEGKGLSWNQGIPLKNIDNSTWRWTGETGDQLKFKLLINDSVWSQGEDIVAAPGQKLEISPAF